MNLDYKINVLSMVIVIREIISISSCFRMPNNNNYYNNYDNHTNNHDYNHSNNNDYNGSTM